MNTKVKNTTMIAAGVATIGALAATSGAFAAINSNVYIDARETFLLGGSQPGAFSVKGENKGKVAVEVLAREDGETTLIATIAPGERFKQNFAQGEGALLRNTSEDARAHVKVRVTGTTRNLGMRYEGW